MEPFSTEEIVVAFSKASKETRLEVANIALTLRVEKLQAELEACKSQVFDDEA